MTKTDTEDSKLDEKKLSFYGANLCKVAKEALPSIGNKYQAMTLKKAIIDYMKAFKAFGGKDE